MAIELPAHLLRDSRTDLRTDFTGKLGVGEDSILTTSDGIPVKEVKIHDNIAVLNPGEAALSGRFAWCSAVIAKKGDQLFVMHIFPDSQGETDGFISKIKTQALSPGEKFDRLVLLGRAAADHLVKFEQISNEKPGVVQLNTDQEGLFNIVVYNNPDNPGDILSFDLWFGNEQIFGRARS